MSDPKYPDKHIVFLNELADHIEAAYPEISEAIGAITLNGASVDSLDWTAELSEAGERVYRVLDMIFSDITETPTRIIDGMPPKPRFSLSELAGLVLQQTISNPTLSIGDVRDSDPLLSGLTSSQFASLRKEIVSGLAVAGVTLEWEPLGNTKARRYAALVLEGAEVLSSILNGTDNPVEYLDEEPAATEPKATAETVAIEINDPTSAPVEDTVEISPEDKAFRIPFEDIKRFLSTHETFTMSGLIIEELGATLIPKEYVQLIRDDLNLLVLGGEVKRGEDGQYTSLVPQVELAAESTNDNADPEIPDSLLRFIDSHTSFSISSLTRGLFNRKKLPKADFDRLKKQVNFLVRTGAIIKVEQGRYKRVIETGDHQPQPYDAELESMLGQTPGLIRRPGKRRRY